MITMRALKKNHVTNDIAIVRDGMQALDCLFGEGEYEYRDSGRQPGVILMDIKLPRTDGIESLKRIRADERTRLLPVVVLTTSNDERDIVQCYEYGANSYIRKPVDCDRFIDTVGRLAMCRLALNEGPLVPAGR